MINLLLNLKKWVKSMINVDIKRLKYPDQTTVMLHSADPKLTLNHIEYWLNPLINSGVKFSILVRDTNSLKTIESKYPHLQVLYAKSPVDVETVVVAQPNLKIVLYPTNRAKNIHLLRFIELTHIFIGTKHSDKLSKINKSYRAYDEIWVSGQAQVDKFKESIDKLGGLIFKVIGKPQYINFFLSEREDIKKDILFILSSQKSIFSFSNILDSLLLDSSDTYIIETNDKMLIPHFQKFRKHNHAKLIRASVETITYHPKFIVTDFDKVNRFLLLSQSPILVFVPKSINIDLLEIDLPRECFYLFSNAEDYLEIIKELEYNDSTESNREYWLNNYFSPKETQEFFFKSYLEKLIVGEHK